MPLQLSSLIMKVLEINSDFMSPFELFTTTFILKITPTEGTGSIYSLTKSYDPANDCYTRPSSGYITRIHTGKTRHCYALSRKGTMVYPQYCAVLNDIVRRSSSASFRLTEGPVNEVNIWTLMRSNQ